MLEPLMLENYQLRTWKMRNLCGRTNRWEERRLGQEAAGSATNKQTNKTQRRNWWEYHTQAVLTKKRQELIRLPHTVDGITFCANKGCVGSSRLQDTQSMESHFVQTRDVLVEVVFKTHSRVTGTSVIELSNLVGHGDTTPSTSGTQAVNIWNWKKDERQKCKKKITENKQTKKPAYYDLALNTELRFKWYN